MSASIDYEFNKRMYEFNEKQKREAELRALMEKLPEERVNDSITKEYLDICKKG